MPRPEPMGAASGMTAAQPMSSSRLAGDRIVGDVGQHREALLDQHARRLDGRRHVGEERLLVADHLELDERADAGLARQAGGADRVGGGVAAGGVGQDGDARQVEMVEQVLLARIGDVHAPHRDGDDLGARPRRSRRASRRSPCTCRCRRSGASGSVLPPSSNRSAVASSRSPSADELHDLDHVAVAQRALRVARRAAGRRG